MLPSSVHEVLIISGLMEMEPKMLGEVNFWEVNKNEVEPWEVLSDRVYSYDKRKTPDS